MYDVYYEIMYVLNNITLYNYIYLVKATNKGVWKVIMESMNSILVQRNLTAALKTKKLLTHTDHHITVNYNYI